MEKRLLNFQADRIEMVLAAHKAPARVWGGRMTARTIQFHLAPASHTKLHRLEALTEEVALALGVRSARLTRTDGVLSLEVPRADSQFLSLGELTRKLDSDERLKRAAAIPGTAILGTDVEGVPLLLRLSSPDVAHCLIAGTTGSGKTELARTMLASLTLHQKPRELQLALFDPKQHGLAPLASAPHLLFPIVSDVADTLDRLSYLVSEMERRDRDLITRPRIVIVVDELADVIETGGAEVEALLTRLVQRGRSAGLSVIACTQKPTARAVGTLMKANFPVRLVGRVASAEDARVAAGVGGTGAEKLAGRGDFLLIASGQIIRFQVAHTTSETWQDVRLGGSSARSASERSGVDRAGIFGRLRRVK
jgi:DNA segregation ATPase FtsK/SpoIIIE, S-DNA-T family